MTCQYNTCFKGIDNISQDLLLNILEGNFKMFLDWSFLSIGAWFDAKISNSGIGTIYGTVNPHAKLILVDDPSYTTGQVWQGIRSDWVWESGINHAGNSPINISGLYVNNTYVPYSGNSFNVNYNDGRVIFNSGVAKTSSIKLDYSYRLVHVYRASESPWFNILQYPSLDNSSADIVKISDGEWSIAGNHRIQLPAIVIESVPRSKSRPYELGNNKLWLEQDIAFYVYAENKNDRNKILDILRLQQDLTIQLFDTNRLAQDDNYPLNYNGDRKNLALMYPNIVDQYFWRKCSIVDVSLFELESITPNLYQGLARATTEVISD
jgi:hypothetical protein